MSDRGGEAHIEVDLGGGAKGGELDGMWHGLRRGGIGNAVCEGRASQEILGCAVRVIVWGCSLEENESIEVIWLEEDC